MLILRFLLIFAALLPLSAHAAWQRATSAHFVVYADADDRWLRGYVSELERFDMLARQAFRATDRPAGARLTVFVLNSPGEVRAVHGKGQNVGGFYVPGPGGAMAVVPKSTGSMQDADVILRHEYAHHLMMQYFPAAYPAWYVEGFADFLSTAQFDKQNFPSLGMPPAARWLAVQNAPRLGLEALLTADMAKLTPFQRPSLYAEGWLLTHYLSVTKERTGQLQRYLDLMNGGRASRDAAVEAFGDLARLQDDFDRYRKLSTLNYFHLAQPFTYGAEIRIDALDPTAADTIRERIALTRGVPDDRRAAVVAALEQALARDPDSPETWMLLARAHLNLRALDAAEAAADKALALNPAIGRAAMWKALAIAGRLRDGKDGDPEKWKEVRRWIIQANKADPEDPVPLRENYRVYRLAGLAPSPVARQGLAKAFSLLPQNVGLRFEYVQSLVQDRQFDAADALLQPVANAPHGGETAAAARRMIASIAAAKARGATEIAAEPIEDEEDAGGN